MNKLVTALVGGMIVLSSALNAQGFEFKVLANKGDNQAKIGGGSWGVLKTGTTLKGGDVIKLGAGSYVGLFHKSGKTLELKDPGEHKISDLSSKMGNTSNSVASKYADFVLSKMSPEQREENRRKYASVTGAVERATQNAELKVMMKPSAEVYDEYAILTWDDAVEGKEYQVTLKNLFDEEILSTKTADNYFKIDFTNEKLASQNLVIFNVSWADDADVNSGDYGLKRVTDKEAASFEDELVSLKQNLGDASSLNYVILAEFFEQNNLLVDALTNYVSAIQMSPEVDYFQEVFEEFKMRHGLGK